MAQIAPRDHMVMDPTGAYYVLWNGPGQVDIGGPGVSLPSISIRDLHGRGWLQLQDSQGNPLPVAIHFDGQALLVEWLANGPPAAQSPQSPIDPIKELEDIQTTNVLIQTGWLRTKIR